MFVRLARGHDDCDDDFPTTTPLGPDSLSVKIVNLTLPFYRNLMLVVVVASQMNVSLAGFP